MSTTALPSPTPSPISVGGRSLYPNPGKTCTACTTERKHRREWISEPSGPDRQRTLVLCFDGTGDSFDKDVSQLTSPSHLESPLTLSTGLIEFQHRAIPGDVDERRSHEAARLLSGHFPRSMPDIRSLPSYTFIRPESVLTPRVYRSPVVCPNSWTKCLLSTWANTSKVFPFLLAPYRLIVPDQLF